MTTTKTPFTIFMCLHATRAWLDLEPQARFAFLDETVAPLLRKHSAVTLRFFDAEAFHAHTSDLAMWQTHDLHAYQDLVEDLRDTAFWNHYFEVRDIVPALENAYTARRPAA